MKRTVQTPTKLIRLNRATGIPSSFSLFFLSLSFFSFGFVWLWETLASKYWKSQYSGSRVDQTWKTVAIARQKHGNRKALWKIGKNSTNTTWRITTAIWRISVGLKIPLYPEFAMVQTKENGKLTSAVSHFKTADWTRIVDCKLQIKWHRKSC